MARSGKAERELVRRQLLADGVPFAQIAVEMGRRFGVRPRVAWRYALGWEQWKAVQEYRSADPTSKIDDSRISKWESWPYGGSRPTPENLVVLTLAFGHGCKVNDLVDEDDLRSFSPTVRKLLGLVEHSPSPAASAEPRAVASGAPYPGSDWKRDLPATMTTVTAMWAADTSPSAAQAPWLAATGDAAMLHWRYDPSDEPAPGGGSRSVRPSDISGIHVMADAFAQTDHRLGGGYARSTLRHYLQESVSPLLRARRDEAGRDDLLAAVARLCDIAGFMAFDSGQQGAGQRYFVQALRLAKAAGNQALGAHILGDMTIQAVHLGEVGHATALADAAVEAAQDLGSPRVLARSLALSARASAKAGDAAGADSAMFAAEVALDGESSRDDPPWIAFFTETQLQTEALYAAVDLGRLDRVEELAATVLVDDVAMQRRHVLAAAAIAGAYVAGAGDVARGRDLDRALALLHAVLPTAAALSSARGVAAVEGVRRRVAAFGRVPGLPEFEERIRTVLGTTVAAPLTLA
ncbi:hypothetical protein [Promicromonospora iranensis]|uniref:Transcriptional regulator n=1 Tax=Promicromonospora iranensis TaxID=1105144 RepID=A0ABU2CIN4_9MICO|nr:hypothetical protein [Promicromonospora iranensis]MDR7381172.1 hypothetical protein [Promicromonospora iranensis]